MSGPVLSLIAVDAMNNLFPNNYSMNFDTINAASNIRYQIPRDCDVIIFDGLIIPKSINLNSIKNIRINIGGNIAYSIPFELIIIANINMKSLDNNYLITIPNELLNFNSSNDILKNQFCIPLVSLTLHGVRFELNSSANFEYHIITKKIYLDTEVRQSLAQQPQNIDIYQYQEFPITNRSNIINPRFVSNGLYIKTESHMIEYELYLNGILHNKISKKLIDFYSFLQYKKTEWTIKKSNQLYLSLYKHLPNEIIYHIEKFIDKKGEYIYYIPFGMINNMSGGTINFSSLNHVRVQIKTNDDNYNGCIYVKNVNRLQIQGGMGGLRYAS